MASPRISRGALQQLVFERLKAAPGCEGAGSVVIVTRVDNNASSTWKVGVFDSGTSATDACRKAIAAIEACLAGRHTVVEDG
jgi:hypothetical protein